MDLCECAQCGSSVGCLVETSPVGAWSRIVPLVARNHGHK